MTNNPLSFNNSTYESQIFVVLDLNTFTELSDQSRVRMFSTAR